MNKSVKRIREQAARVLRATKEKIATGEPLEWFGATPWPLRVLVQHRPHDEASLKREYQEKELDRIPDTFVMYRIIGNDLYPRHAKGQSRQNVRFILENEPDLEDCEKHWVLNRIFDADERQAIIDLLEQHGQKYFEIPFDAAVFSQIDWDYSAYPEPGFLSSETFHELESPEQERALTAAYRLKNIYLMNNNGARNAALAEGRSRAKWVLPWDGNCFVTASAWEAVRSAVRAAPHLPYFVVPMQRIKDNDELLADNFDPNPVEEPQLVFRSDARETFGENHPYGRRPKVELLTRLGIPGPWEFWRDDPWEQPCGEDSSDRGAWGVAGWVARLASGRSHLETPTTGGRRNRSLERQKAIRAAINHVTQEVGGQPDPIGLTSFHFDAIDALRAEYQERGDSGAQGKTLQVLLRNAAEALERIPESPVDKPQPGPSGDMHDYYHPAPYWWPNPGTKDGLPYVRRDGERVPGTHMGEPESHYYDRTRLQWLFDDTTSLSLAAFITGERRYAEHAVRWLERWFIDPETRMNPHLTYAQVRWGHNRNHGAASGIIEMKDLYYALDAVRLLHRIGALSSDQLERLRAWFREYLDWLLASEQGTREAQAENNRGTYYDLQVAAIAAFLGDMDTLFATLARAEGRLAVQISETGIQYHELARTQTQHYTCFNLQGWLNLDALATRYGLSFSRAGSAHARRLREALVWLQRQRQNDVWPYPQGDPFNAVRYVALDCQARRQCLLPDQPRAPGTPPPADHALAESVAPLASQDGLRPYWQITRTAKACPGKPAVVFLIPLQPRSTATRWEDVVHNLDNTLRSILNQNSRNFIALVICHELPESDFLGHPKINFLQAPFPPESDPQNGSVDKYRKRRHGAAWARHHGYGGAYFFGLDADDWVSRHFVATAEDAPMGSGLLAEQGYIFDVESGDLSLRAEKFYRICGSCFVCHYDANELPIDYADEESAFSHVACGHHAFQGQRARDLGKVVHSLNKPLIAYLVNHTESLYSKKRDGKKRGAGRLRNKLTQQHATHLVRFEFGAKERGSPQTYSLAESGAQTHPIVWTPEDIPDDPWMPEEARDHLEMLLARSSVFLEYGAGGSSILAGRTGVAKLYSVESDESFLSAIADKLRQTRSSITFHPEYVDIGPTRKLGYPVDSKRESDWARYPCSVWETLHDRGETPDLVLIDGRFRVACFLATLLNAKAGTLVLFDDYYRRERYWIIETVLAPRFRVGRMAEFKVSSNMETALIESLLEEYVRIPN